MNGYGPELGVSDGIRTRDRLDHNQELYQLSYAHREVRTLSLHRGLSPTGTGTDCG